MTVAVACNLSEGVILGVDSAIAVPAGEGILKVYENAEKLFQLGNKPIGIAVYGLGSFGNRSIGSYIREFELTDPSGVMGENCSLPELTEALRHFFFNAYGETIVPGIEKQTGRPFDELAPDKRPAIGFVVGGFSAGQYLSEVWNILIPHHAEENSAERARPAGNFGTSWYAQFGPIRRYIKGYDPVLINELLAYIQGAKGGFAPEETAALQAILQKHEYGIPYSAMPMEEGVEHVRFLVGLVINHHRYVIGAPIVGGKIKIGKVTYKGARFEILE